MVGFGDYPRMTSVFGSADPLADTTVTHITKEMSIPFSAGGAGISRHKMNGIGYLATIGGYLDAIGYPYGFNSEVAARGYPKGAIVSNFDGKTLREYVSLKDNNTSIDLPDTIYDETENDSWRPLQTGNNYNYFPDFANGSKIFEKSLSSTETITVPITTPCWVDIRRRFVFKDDYFMNEKIDLFYKGWYNYIRIGDRDKDYDIYQRHNPEVDDFCIWSSEGESASRFLPVSSDLSLYVHIEQQAERWWHHKGNNNYYGWSELMARAVEFSMNIQVWEYPLLETLV